MLSFGEAEEEQEAAVVIKKKDMSRSDRECHSELAGTLTVIVVADQSRDSREPVASKTADEPRKAKREDSPKARAEERKVRGCMQTRTTY